jgi:GntR family transcriptional regulator
MSPRLPSSSTLSFALDLGTGVPAYRQIIDQILGAVASGAVRGGDQLPTVRQLAVDLSVNPNTVVRAYRELEIRSVLTTQQGVGTFITTTPVQPDEVARQRQLDQIVSDVLARAGAAGVTADELLGRLQEFITDQRGNSQSTR